MRWMTNRERFAETATTRDRDRAIAARSEAVCFGRLMRPVSGTIRRSAKEDSFRRLNEPSRRPWNRRVQDGVNDNEQKPAFRR